MALKTYKPTIKQAPVAATVTVTLRLVVVAADISKLIV